MLIVSERQWSLFPTTLLRKNTSNLHNQLDKLRRIAYVLQQCINFMNTFSSQHFPRFEEINVEMLFYESCKPV
jgi:hypothetical protein